MQEFRIVVGQQDFIEDNDLDFAGIPENFELSQNYPNPFNPETRINYELPSASHVKVVVYNLKGQFVQSLFDGQQGPGRYSLLWNGRAENGSPVASGVYLVRMQAGKFVSVKKMVLTK